MRLFATAIVKPAACLTSVTESPEAGTSRHTKSRQVIGSVVVAGFCLHAAGIFSPVSAFVCESIALLLCAV